MTAISPIAYICHNPKNNHMKKNQEDHIEPIFSLYRKIVAVLIVFIFLLFLFISHNFVNNKNLQLSREAQKIEKEMSEHLDYANSINVYVGRQIADHGADDLNFILNLFRKITAYNDKANHLFSKTTFGWYDSENRMVVDNTYGIETKNPPNISYRDYTQQSRKRPWTLRVSSPSFGNSSGMWVIPASTGITDKNGKFLGGIAIGIDIAHLSSQIQDLIDKNVSFVVLDNKFNLVIKSDISIKNEGESYEILLRKVCNTLSENAKVLDNALKKDGVIYSYYRNFSNYPYIVLVGYNRKAYYLEMFSVIAPVLLQVLLMILIIMLLLKPYLKMTFSHKSK